MDIVHAGRVEFEGGTYRSVHTDGWKVAPIYGFKPLSPPKGINPPLGQVGITFDKPLDEPYLVLVTAARSLSTPSLAANYGAVTKEGFVVHLWETCADRTVQNGGFSFLVARPGRREQEPV